MQFLIRYCGWPGPRPQVIPGSNCVLISTSLTYQMEFAWWSLVSTKKKGYFFGWDCSWYHTHFSRLWTSISTLTLWFFGRIIYVSSRMIIYYHRLSSMALYILRCAKYYVSKFARRECTLQELDLPARRRVKKQEKGARPTRFRLIWPRQLYIN